MSSKVLFTIDVLDSSGNTRIVRAVRQSYKTEFLEDAGPRHNENHFLRLDDGRILKRAADKTLQADDKETFRIVKINNR